MRNLIQFIYKNNFFFVFLLLEMLCVILMVKNHGYQGSSLINSGNEISAEVYQTSANVKEYLLLKDENERLSRENAMIHNFLKSGYAVIPLESYVKHDTLYKQMYKYMSAKAINNSVNKRSNYLTLNIGSEQGITHDMAVINSDGIVGIVKDASKNFSSCMSILHKDVRINCELKKDHSFGTLMWDGADYRYCQLSGIPTSSIIKKGDTVITSSLSGIFPSGIMVGKVESWERKQNESFYTVQVSMNVDFKKVNHVYVINFKYKQEKDSLEQISQVQGDK